MFSRLETSRPPSLHTRSQIDSVHIALQLKYKNNDITVFYDAVKKKRDSSVSDEGCVILSRASNTGVSGVECRRSHSLLRAAPFTEMSLLMEPNNRQRHPDYPSERTDAVD